MSDKKLIMAGYSGHGFVVAESAQTATMNLTHYCDLQPLMTNPFNLRYAGFEGAADFIGWNDGYDFILGVGDNSLRQKIAKLILSKNKQILNVVHPAASLSKHITIGTGNFIARQVSISPLASIGDFCILNTGSIIEHECVIGEAVHIAPGAVLAGNVRIGDRSFVGANSVIRQGVTVGKDVVIGAGSVIIKNIPDRAKVVGNPSRQL